MSSRFLQLRRSMAAEAEIFSCHTNLLMLKATLPACIDSEEEENAEEI